MLRCTMMVRLTGRTLLFTLLLVAGTQFAAADWAVSLSTRAPGTDIVLDLPEGWSPSALIPGFGNDTIEATIVVTDQAGVTLDQLRQKLSADTLGLAGFTSIEEGSLVRSDTHLFVRAQRLTGEEAYASFILGFGHAGGAALVTAHVPARFLAEGRITPADIEAVLATARHEPAAL
jgi:hypothetical protein